MVPKVIFWVPAETSLDATDPDPDKTKLSPETKLLRLYVKPEVSVAVVPS